MFLILPPATELAALVTAYWFVEDLPGEHAGRLIRTSPVPHAVLSVNMGRPNAAADGGLVPGVSFLGLQSRSRAWQSWPNTYFVMVMLTVRGVVHLFPHTGSESAGMLLDLAALTGDGPARSLANDISPEQNPARIAAQLDQWLISRLRNMSRGTDGEPVAIAQRILRSGGTVQMAADAAQVSRRKLHRSFQRHLGIGPKELANLERLHSSLRGVQSGHGDPMDGFSDQAHQVRSWQRRLGVTPGAYTRSPPSALVHDLSASSAGSGLAYYF